MTRLVLVSGKGGVGKTTVAAATAARCAALGQRALVVSVDRAHNLGDVLGVALGAAPTEVPGAPGLWAMEADAQVELREHEGALRGYFARLLAWAGVSAAQADEVAVVPGLEELLVLSRLMALVEGGGFDVVVVDLAPTASSLKLLSFPELMAGPVGRFARWERSFLKVARPAVRRVVSAPLPDDEVYATIDLLAARLGRLRDALTDPARAVVRLVCVPERVVVDETRRAHTLMSLFGLAVDRVVINRVLPDDLAGTSLGRWVEVQRREVARARESFAGLAVSTLGYGEREVLGLDALDALGRALYGDDDPSAPGVDAAPVRYAADEPALSIALPHGGAAGALDLRQQGDELIITVGGWRRRLLLPDSLRGRAVASARLARGALRVGFDARRETPP